MPGLVDTHVHINEPGRTDWEGFETATRAAAAGGVTTLIDMPLNSIPATTTAAALENQAHRGAQEMLGECGLLGRRCAGQCRRTARAASRRACSASNVFSCRRAFRNLQTSPKTISAPRCRYLPRWTCRCWFTRNCRSRSKKRTRKLAKADPRKYKTWLLSRPPAAETKAIEMMIRLAREFKARVHIVHLSSELSRASDSSREEGGRAHHGGNVPALSVFRRGRDPERTDGI